MRTTIVCHDPHGRLAEHFKFPDWTPDKELRINASGDERSLRQLASDLRRIAGVRPLVSSAYKLRVLGGVLEELEAR